jgi:hypothetical protein
MSCPVDLRFRDDYQPPGFESTRRSLEFLDNGIPRFGKSADLLDLIQGSDEEKKDYLLGLTAASMAIFGFFGLWILLWGIWSWLGHDIVGVLSGSRIRMTPPPQPKSVEPYPVPRETRPRSTGSTSTPHLDQRHLSDQEMVPTMSSDEDEQNENDNDNPAGDITNMNITVVEKPMSLNTQHEEMPFSKYQKHNRGQSLVGTDGELISKQHPKDGILDIDYNDLHPGNYEDDDSDDNDVHYRQQLSSPPISPPSSFISPANSEPLSKSHFISPAVQRKREIEKMMEQRKMLSHQNQNATTTADDHDNHQNYQTNKSMSAFLFLAPEEYAKVLPDPPQRSSSAMEEKESKSMEQQQQQQQQQVRFEDTKTQEDDDDDVSPARERAPSPISLALPPDTITSPPQATDIPTDQDLDLNVDWEYEAELAAWQKELHRTDVQLLRMRILIFLCGAGLVAACILFTVLGVLSLTQSISQGQESLTLVRENSNELTNLLQDYRQHQRLAQNMTDEVLTKINVGYCPLVRRRLCLNITAPNLICNLDDIPLQDQIDSFLNFLGGSLSNQIVYPPDEFVEMEGDIDQLFNQVDYLDDNMSQFNWAFWLASGIANATAILVLAILWGIVAAWQGKSNEIYKCLRSTCIMPVLLLLVINGWVFSMAFVIGSAATADLCRDSPNDKVLAYLEQVQGRYLTQVYDFNAYYISECPLDQQPVNAISDRVIILSEVFRPVATLVLALQSSDPEAYQDTCGNGMDTIELEEMVSALALKLCLLLRELVRCVICGSSGVLFLLVYICIP